MLPSQTASVSPLAKFSWLHYLHHIRKRLWLVIFIVLIGISLGAIQVAKTRPLFRASARVLVEQEVVSSSVTPFHNPYMAHDLKSAFHQTQLKLLKSRSLAREVIASLQLAEHPEFASVNAPQSPGVIQSLKTWAMPYLIELKAYVFEKGEKVLASAPPSLQAWIGWPLETDASPKSPAPSDAAPVPAKTPAASPTEPISNDSIALTNSFLKRLKIQSDINSSLIHLHFEAYDPKLAATVPNTLAQLYMNQVKNKRFEKAHEGIDWLQKRVEEMEEKVENSEIELERYRQEHNTYSVDGQLPGVMQQLVAINTSLTVVQTERIKLGALYQKVEKEIDRPDVLQSLIDGTGETVMPELKRRYDELERELNQLTQNYGPEHPQVRKLRIDLEAQERKIDDERQRLIDVAKSRYEVVQDREAALLARHDELKREVQELNEKAIRYGRLKRKMESNQRLAKVLIDRLGETNLNMKMMGGTKFELVDPAEVPTVAINYRPVHTMTITGAVGLILALGVAAGLGFLDNRLDTPDDTAYLGFPVIGTITQHKASGGSKSKGGSEPVLMLEAPSSPTAEAYRMLRTNVLFSYADPPRKVFLVTSSHPNEGKTTVSANLAYAMSQMDRRILLLEADLRNPSIHKFFDLDGQMGLSELLLREDYDGCIHPYQGNLSIVPTGERPPNPSELLGSKRMEKFLAYAREHFDAIVIDTPPILAVSDALILSPLVDGILMVIRSNVTSYDHAKRAISQLLTLRTNLPTPLDQAGMAQTPGVSLGLVMNCLDPRSGRTYGYYGKYNHYYSGS
ncbi:MAG: hypothetical protein ETSY2_12115 [Candidatus Entotheonella gemina]|uniref:Polysaccharide chain length determinant N-terminal domain-containing protein n=1 Tax=Candidatus Entotheonella gemina TaxID=1429439 RepID=W4MCD8_9BACT|nr:MAG: hypothetical protein ETSY2_12115 [Candidatus Entotheonella gemina]